MSVEELRDAIVELTVQVGCRVTLTRRVNLVDQVVNHGEVVQVVDLLLGDGCLHQQRPHFLIVPLERVQLSSKIEQRSLVMADFLFPEG